MIDTVGSQDWHQLATIKQAKLRNLRDLIHDWSSGTIHLLDDKINLGNTAPTIDGYRVKRYPLELWNSFAAGHEQPDFGQDGEVNIVLMTNNDIITKLTINTYINLRRTLPQAIFIAWDFDNHHWLLSSMRCALASDVYVPAHFDNLYPL